MYFGYVGQTKKCSMIVRIKSSHLNQNGVRQQLQIVYILDASSEAVSLKKSISTKNSCDFWMLICSPERFVSTKDQ